MKQSTRLMTLMAVAGALASVGMEREARIVTDYKRSITPQPKRNQWRSDVDRIARAKAKRERRSR
jgi:hypothetical protein